MADPVVTTKASMSQPPVVEKKPVTTPWKPASLLTVDAKFKRPGYVQRWCNKEQLERHLAEGWSPILGDINSASPAVTLTDGTQLTRLIKKRDLILCEMPIEMAKSRKDFYTNQAKSNFAGSVGAYSQGEEAAAAKKDGGGVYGDIKIENKPGDPSK